MNKAWALAWLLLPYVAAADASTPRASATGFDCIARLEAARAALLRASFDPARDTEAWLKVSGLTDGGLELHIYTVYSPDGDGYRAFAAEIRPSRTHALYGWRLVERNRLDELKEERLPERLWTSARAGWRARVFTRSEDRTLVALFERIVRAALDDCLDHPGQQGKIERCEYSNEQNRELCDYR
jgi:hypothetical protein